MSPYEIIATKRDGHELPAEAIAGFIDAFMRDEVRDYQMTAWLMAAYIRGLSEQETVALTHAYINSGQTVDLSAIPGIKVDKHSTGGVGDKVSIILAPLVASLGIPVPMISGRGLGHTGGTLDKLESIPGFQTQFDIERFQNLIRQHGLALIGQTAELVPADRRIYALRDVTATVDSIPLICASIMSKKIAEGIDALVLDVKYGNGAFIPQPENAELLARKMIQIGQAAGKQVVALLTSMEQPLGRAVGNWLEIEECIACFHGKGPKDLMEVTLALSAEMVVLGGKAGSLESGLQLCRVALTSGKAWEKFLEIVTAQGGDTAVLEHPRRYPKARFRAELKAGKAGYVAGFHTREVGMASVELGAGRLRAEDPVDPQAGILLHRKLGELVEEGQLMAELYTNRQEALPGALKRLARAIRIDSRPPQIPPLVLKRIT